MLPEDADQVGSIHGGWHTASLTSRNLSIDVKGLLHRSEPPPKKTTCRGKNPMSGAGSLSLSLYLQPRGCFFWSVVQHIFRSVNHTNIRNRKHIRVETPVAHQRLWNIRRKHQTTRETSAYSNIIRLRLQTIVVTLQLKKKTHTEEVPGI